MDKLITFPGKNDNGIFTYVIDTESSYLMKTACEYHPEISSYITSAKKIPGKTQVLLTALGAGEYWGCNVNGDYFPEASLAHPGDDYGYRTFEKNAKVYKHHVNKDPNASYGEVALAVYNPKYHRVELIVVLDNEKAPDIVEKIDNGEYPSWSMGCKVPYDVCSICGNKARTRAEYCQHLKYYMGRIDPSTGKQAYAINTLPKFFDISQVFIGADKIARTLKKVASIYGYDKSAEIKKEIPVNEPPASADDITEDIQNLKDQEQPLPKEILNDVATKFTLPQILSTLAAMRIVPRPQEFQRIVLVSTGRNRMADDFDDRGICFDPMSAGDFGHRESDVVGIDPYNINPSLITEFSPFVGQRSFAPAHFVKRVTVLVKKASDESLAKDMRNVAVAGLIATLYHAVMKNAAKNVNAKILPEVLLKNPGLAALLGFGVMTAPMFLGKAVAPGTAGNAVRMEREFGPSDFHERHLANPITKVGNKALVGLGMTFGSLPLANAASSYLNKKRMTDPEYREGTTKNFVRRYPELAAIATSAAGMGLLAGRPIPNKIYNVVAKTTKTVLDTINKGLPKHASESVSDFMIDSLVWPLALGGRNIPHKIVGGMLDQAAIEGVGRLSNKRTKDKLNTKN